MGLDSGPKYFSSPQTWLRNKRTERIGRTGATQKRCPPRSQTLDLGVGTQAVELIQGFVSMGGTPLAELGGDLVKGSALGLRHLEVGEDEEEDQQDGEDDEDVGATEVLQGEKKKKRYHSSA